MAKKRIRSPRYPICGLKTAIERLETFYDKEGKATVPRDIAVKAWGYTTTSGPALQSVATLILYGLLDRIGGKNVKISEIGLGIVWPKNSTEKEEAIKQAYLNPPIFRELLDEYEGEIPSDEALKAYLLRRTTPYNENAADTLINSFRETLDFAEDYMTVNTKSESDLVEIQPKKTVYLSSKLPESKIQPWMFPIGGQMILISFSHKKPTSEDLEILKQYLDLSAQSLEGPSEG